MGSNHAFKPTAEITPSFFRRAPRGGGLTRRYVPGPTEGNMHVVSIGSARRHAVAFTAGSL